MNSLDLARHYNQRRRNYDSGYTGQIGWPILDPGGGGTTTVVNPNVAQAQAGAAAAIAASQNQQYNNAASGGTGIDASLNSALEWGKQNWFVVLGVVVAWKLFTADSTKRR